MTPRLALLRRRTAAALAALVSGVLVLSGCSVYDAPLPGGADAGDDPMKVTLMFRDVLDLVPQSTVKVNDVTVGNVTKVDLKGYVARVTIELPKDTDLPENTRAQIRQTSLLGEKFISLSAPQEPSSGKLSDNDVIGLDHTGRNPEVEEVLGALSLLLNGGGVGQLKTIASELNTAFDGRESEIRSVLTQIRIFMGQLDDNKGAIVNAIENTNRLAVEIRDNDDAVKSALDDIPDTLRSVNRQRDDLVKLLEALTRLSGVGTRVIRASKESTINSLRQLGPVLEGFAEAGQDFPKSLQVFLTYPFVDEAVGRDPQVARNLHMGDYTNLSVNLDVSLTDLALPELPAIPVPPEICAAVKRARAQANRAIDRLPGLTSEQRKNLKTVVLAQIEDKDCGVTVNTVRQYIAAALLALGDLVTGPICDQAPDNPICRLLDDPTVLPPLTLPPALDGGGLGGALSGGSGGGLGGGLPRPAPGGEDRATEPIDPFGLAKLGLDPGIGTMLLQGVAEVR